MNCVAALIIFDTPYGVGQAPWDKEPLSAEDLQVILSQINAVQSGVSGVIALWGAWTMLPEYHKVLQKTNYNKDLHKIFWYKENQNVEGNKDQFTLAVEELLVGRMKTTDKTLNTCQLPNNPVERHNIITGPTLHTYKKNEKGEKINMHEKPKYLATWLCETFTKPGDWVLVIGAGAGGEVFGALDGMCNVVAIEKDPEQAEALESNLRRYESELEMKERTSAKQRKAKKNAIQKAKDDALARACHNCGCHRSDEIERPCIECDLACCKTCLILYSEAGEGCGFCGPACEVTYKKSLKQGTAPKTQLLPELHVEDPANAAESAPSTPEARTTSSAPVLAASGISPEADPDTQEEE